MNTYLIRFCGQVLAVVEAKDSDDALRIHEENRWRLGLHNRVLATATIVLRSETKCG